jgi:dolichol-phosphate mannosyltransferase
LFKRLTARWFYALMRTAVDSRLTPEVGDFRLFSRAAVLTIRRMREQHRFLRGMVAWLGMKEAVLPFHRQPRVAGVTKFPTWKMLKFAWTAISSFSALPLKFSLYGGLMLTLCGLFYGLWVTYETLALGTTVRGWSSLVCLQLIFNGAILSAVGLMGDYVARIYEESKARPLYVVSDAVNFRSFDTLPARGIVMRHETSPGNDFRNSPAPR